MANKELKTRIQLIRNSTVILEQKNPKTLNGEFYICKTPDSDITKFKIGDGRNFNEIPYYEEDLLKSLGIEVNDADYNQILVFNGVSGKWENETFFNDNEFTFDGENGLSIKGYEDAQQGWMLVKDINYGIVWTKPLDTTQLNTAVAYAEAAAAEAAGHAVEAGNQAVAAETSALQAEKINQQTMTWINNKFWWGTLEEYNNLPEVFEGTYYFVGLSK